jgi:hypothetical protein
MSLRFLALLPEEQPMVNDFSRAFLQSGAMCCTSDALLTPWCLCIGWREFGLENNLTI